MATETIANNSIRRLATAVTALPADVTPPGPKAVILDVALRLFAENGYSGASIRDIASAAGLKPASIYAHYKSKDEILAQLIDIGHREHFQYVQQAVAESLPDAGSQLRAYVDAHVRFHADFSMLAILVNHELHALAQDYVASALNLRDQAVGLLSDIVARGASSGAFAIGHDLWLAVAAIGATGMRVAHWYSPEHERSVDEIAGAYADFACRLVGATKPDFEGAGVDETSHADR